MGAGQFAVYTAFKAKDGVSPVFKNMTRGASDFETKLGRLNNSVIGVGKSIRNNLIGALAGYFSFQAFKNIGMGIISVTAKFEQFRISLQTLLKSKDAGNKFFGSLVKFASITPLEVQDIIPAARQLLAYGVVQDQIVNKLGRLSDLSMGDSEKFSQLVYAYGKTKTIGIASMRELRMFSTAGVQIFDVLAKIKKTSKAGILDMVKDRKILFSDIDNALTNLTNKDGMFYNMTIKQSQTLQGLWSTSKDTLDMIADKLGNSGNHLNAMRGVLKYFNAHEEEITNFLLKLSDGLDKIFISLKPLFSGLGRTFKELSGLSPALNFLFNSIFIPALVMSVEQFNRFLNIVGKTYNFIKSNWIPILSVLAGVGGMLALKKAFDTVNGAIVWFNTLTMISGAEGIIAMSGFQKVSFILGGYTKALWGSVKAIGAQTLALLTNPWTWVAIGIAAIVAGTILLWKNWDKVTAGVSVFWEKSKTVFGSFTDILLTALGPIGWIIKGMVTIGEKLGIIKGIGQGNNALGGGSVGGNYSAGRPTNPSYKQPIYNNASIQNSQMNGRIKVGVDINNSSMFPATSSLGLSGSHGLNLVPGS